MIEFIQKIFVYVIFYLMICNLMMVDYVNFIDINQAFS